MKQDGRYTGRLEPVVKRQLAMCVSCGACADSCFFYRRDPLVENIPALKVNGTLRKLVKIKRNLKPGELEVMKDLLWGHCVLCGRCYCPMGIDIPSLLSYARRIMRENDIYEHYELGPLGLEEITG